MNINFTIPNIKAKPKQSTRFSRFGNYTDPKVKAYQDIISRHAKEAMIGNDMFTGKPLQCNILISRAIPKSWSKKKRKQALDGEILPISRPDVDNYAKPILDAMNGIVYEDDSCVCTLTITKVYGLEDKVIVIVKPLTLMSRIWLFIRRWLPV